MNEIFDFEKHEKLSKEILDKFIRENVIVLEFLEYEKYIIEIRNYSRSGINILLNIKEIDPYCKFRFEVAIDMKEDYDLIGFVDCIVETNIGIMIFDFKRSAASIPSFSGWKEYSKIQLWFYANYAGIKIDDIACLGYLNLSDIENSLILPTSTDVYSELFGKIGSKINKKEFPFIELCNAFQEFCHDTICEIREEKDFLANPKDNSVCTYCSVSNVCSRGRI